MERMSKRDNLLPVDRLTEEERVTLELQEAVCRRRALFAKHLTPEVLDAIAEFAGVQDCIFAFTVDKEGKFDVLTAMRRDTLAGIIRALHYEVEHLHEAEATLQRMMDEIQQIGGNDE